MLPIHGRPQEFFQGGAKYFRRAKVEILGVGTNESAENKNRTARNPIF